MFCQACGIQIPESSNYCSKCGAKQGATRERKQLLRSRTNSKIAGVCGGIAEYFDIDPTLVRVMWAIFSIIPGCLGGRIIAYLVLWMIVPKAPATVSAPATLEPQAKTS